MAKTIITAALTGAVTPAGYNIPETPEEIAKDAYEVWKLGAAIVHLHMRDEQGMGVMDKKKFEKTIQLIRKNKDCDVIINCTSSGDHRVSGGDDYGNAKRMEHLKEIKGIEMGSYDAGSFNWMPGGVFMNTPKFLKELGNVYLEKGIKPEIEIFDVGMLNVAEYFVKKGNLPSKNHYQFCLGVKGAMPATVENLLYLKSHIPKDSTWSAFGVGAGHLPILFATLALGGHIRVGLEDNVIYSKDKEGNKIMATNSMLVKRAVDAVKAYGNEIATPIEARKMLGIPEFIH
jgi:uncharacterized protein (DUF849 family)